MNTVKQFVEFNFTNNIFINGTHMKSNSGSTEVVVISDNNYKEYFHDLAGRNIVSFTSNTDAINKVIVAESHFLLAKEMYDKIDTAMPGDINGVSRVVLLRKVLNSIGETPTLTECSAICSLFRRGHTDPQRCYFSIRFGMHTMSDINIHKSPEQNTTSLPCVTIPIISPYDGAVVNATVYNHTDDNTPHYCNMPTLTQPQHLFAYLLDQIPANSVYSDTVSFKLSKEDINLLAKQVKVFMEDEDSIGGGRRLKGIEKKAALVKMFNTQVGRRERACQILNSISQITIIENKYKLSTK